MDGHALNVFSRLHDAFGHGWMGVDRFGERFCRRAHLHRHCGFVHEVAKRVMAGQYLDVRAYVAGPPPAVDAAIRVLLLDAKLTTNNIRYDKYS